MRLLLGVAGVLVLLLARAGAEPRIFDAGQVRDFEVALDEVDVVTPDGKGRAERIAPRPDERAIVAHIRSRPAKARLVLYEKDRPRTLFTRRIVTEQVLVQLSPGGNPAGLPAPLVRSVEYAPDFHLFAAPDSAAALDLAVSLRGLPGVLSAEPLLARQQSKRLIPNDPLFSQQWHLRNTGQNGGLAGVDVKITNVWDTFRGTNLIIAIVDDGLQTTHTDLVGNVNTVIDYDFNGRDGSPSPDLSQDFHGTACAGVAAGRGNNGRGVTGAAPEAQLVGLRLIGGPATDLDEADAMVHSNSLIFIKSNSWGPNDDGLTLAGPGPLMAAALRSSVTNGRSGKGTIFVWAAGNGDDAEDNANYDGYGNSIYTIAIGALSDLGTKASYSEPGANLVACAPSSSFNPDRQGITTVDLMGENGYNYTGAVGEGADVNYTKTFGGTSSACPLASGVLALVLQANPNLGWRDVQEILLRTSTQNDPAGGGWRTNAAGFKFSHQYGAGLISASAAVNAALTWTNLAAQTSFASVQSNLSLAIPDNVAGGVTRTFALSNVNLRVEHAVLQVDLTHANRGDLEIFLISPHQTTSQLAEVHADTGNDYADWPFMTVRCWGETGAGTWTVKVADRRTANAGTLNRLRLELFGTQTVSNAPPVLNPIGSASGAASQTIQFAVSATDPDGDPITLTASNLPSGATFASTNANGTFRWTNASPAGVYTSRFFATATGGSDNETVVITVTNPPPGGAANVWINEFHYDNSSTDVGEGFEIAGAAGASLAGYALLLYDGLGGGVYSSNALSGSIDNEGCGFGAVWFSVSGVQNGAPDGVALVRNGTQVVQFISYEGSVTGTAGAASGRIATDVGVKESGTEAAGRSLQLRGSGSAYASFSWGGPTNASAGTLNAGQIIVPCSGQPPVLAAIGNKTVVQSNLLQFAVTATDADGDLISLTVSNKPATATFAATNGSGTFTWTLPGPVGVTTCAFFAADSDGVDAETITLTVSAPPGSGSVVNVWINELHYDNTGADVDEGVEIAGPAGTALGDFSVVLYDGGAATAYKTTALSGSIDNEGCGFGAVWFPASGLQNGAPDGLALVKGATQVVQFLSYEGSFTAAGGAAAGLTSTDIGVFEAGTEPVDRSLQLRGTGNAAAQFVWAGATNPASRGTLNAAQIISGCAPPAGPPPSARFGASSFRAQEGVGTVSIPVALSSAASCTVRVSVAGSAVAGEDFTMLSTQLVFTGTSTQQFFGVSVIDDGAVEVAEDLTLTLVNFTGATTGTPSQAYLDLRDNDGFSIMAANLAQQTDACTSVYGDPSARIFRGLRPDIVAVQEFVTTNAGGVGAFVTNVFGADYRYWVESETNECGIPNGVISRYPITNSGEWADSTVGYRDYVWATIDLPGARNLHMVSVHFNQADGPLARQTEAHELTNFIAQAGFLPDDYLVIAGDLNTTSRSDTVLQILSGVVSDARQPADQLGDKDSNSSRTQIYDYVLPEPALDALTAPIVLGGFTFTNGLVFDSRLWASPPAPILTNDSNAAGVQHMPVMKLFRFPTSGQEVWINELHYDNTGTDTGEGVEVAGSAGLSMTNYSLVLYRAVGTVQNTVQLTGVLDDEGCGFGAAWYAIAGILNGSGGVALVRSGTNVVQFISYNSDIVATAGAALGMTSIRMGVQENGSEPVGQSLQLVGTGSLASQFTWAGPVTASPGSLNANQTLSPCGQGSPPAWVPIGPQSANVSNFLQFSVTALPTDEDSITLTVSNRPPGSTFASTNGNGTLTWAVAAPAGVYTTRFFAADNDGVTGQTVVIRAIVPPPGGIGTLWINEIHYNNVGTPDSGEGVELAGKAGIVLTNYALYRYEGSTGRTDGTNQLSGTMGFESCGFGARWFDYPPDGLENDMSGLALVLRGTQVVHFVSYGGTFTASNGPATGLTSIHAGNQTNPPPPIGQTLQLTGSGTNGTQFAWTGPVAFSTGRLNAGQTILPCLGDGPGPFGLGGGGTPPEWEPIGDKFVVLNGDLFFQVTASDFDGDAVTLSMSGGPAGAMFTSTGGDGYFEWIAAGPAGVYPVTFFAEDVDGVTEQTIMIRVEAWVPPAGAIAYFNFDEGGGFTSRAFYVAAHLGLSPILVGNGSLFGDAAGNPGYAARGGGWTGDTNFFEVSMVVSSGYAAVVNGLTFDDRRMAQGPTLWRWRWSGDGFSANDAEGSTHASFEANDHALRGEVLTGTNAFRLIAAGATLPGATWKIDNLLLRGAVLPEDQDADADGMPDIWEIAQHGDVETADATTDSDEDGMTDADERIAGTQIFDDTSYLRILGATVGPGPWQIYWSSESNRSYVVSRATNAPGLFTGVASNQLATPPINIVTDAPPDSAVIIYRIEIPR